jgi:GT2 family glycosyltransferase
MNTKNIAVLITCHNRREKTLSCLKSLYGAEWPKNVLFDVYLVDDGSTDGTSNEVNNKFPHVNVILGSGNLFWNKGMYLAWETATRTEEYDFYLWLNDDTMLSASALLELMECYEEALKTDKQPAIIVGACQAFEGSNIFSYGGHNKSGPVIPNGNIQTCMYINGNTTLISKDIYSKLGNLSADYTHSIGDSDYGFRAIKAGFKCYTTKNYVAICPPHEELSDWCNPNLTLTQRWKSLHSPKGLNIKEYLIFRKKFWGWKWIIYALKAYIKTIFPGSYSRISKIS